MVRCDLERGPHFRRGGVHQAAQLLALVLGGVHARRPIVEVEEGRKRAHVPAFESDLAEPGEPLRNPVVAHVGRIAEQLERVEEGVLRRVLRGDRVDEQ